MKFYRVLQISVFLLATSLFFGSCEFRENIIFDPDKSGKLTTSFYGEQLGEMLQAYLGDSLEVERKQVYMQDIIDENRAEIDSLPEEYKEKLYSMADAEMRIENQDGDLFISVDKTFQDVNDINQAVADSRAVINYLMDYSEESGFDLDKEVTEEDTSFESQLEVEYSWNNNVFERTTQVKDVEKLQEAAAEFSDLISFGAAGFSYVLEYTFPYEIVEVWPEDAKLSLDRKTVSLRRSFSKIIADPKELDIKIILKQ